MGVFKVLWSHVNYFLNIYCLAIEDNSLEEYIIDAVLYQTTLIIFLFVVIYCFSSLSHEVVWMWYHLLGTLLSYYLPWSKQGYISYVVNMAWLVNKSSLMAHKNQLHLIPFSIHFNIYIGNPLIVLTKHN